MTNDHIHFITGRLAEYALRPVVTSLAKRIGFACSVDVLPITVAALMTPAWIARHARIPVAATRVIVPGYCEGDLAPIQSLTAATVERGPRDLRELDEFFGQPTRNEDYGGYDIEILAEINHAPRLSLAAILKEAEKPGSRLCSSYNWLNSLIGRIGSSRTASIISKPASTNSPLS